MPDKQVVGTIPSFTEDTSVSREQPTEVKTPAEAPAEAVVEEKETPSAPPAEEKPDRTEPVVDTTELTKQVEALQKERVDLLKQLQELRGTRRELKEQEAKRVEQQLDDLKDAHPEDVKLVEKILRNRGYMTKDEAGQMFYEAVKREEIAKFLEEFPEYKPENDPSDANWQRLEREMAWYRRPDDPHLLKELLRRAHRTIAVSPGDRSVQQIKTRQAQVASVGSGGTQRSSSKTKTLDFLIESFC